MREYPVNCFIQKRRLLKKIAVFNLIVILLYFAGCFHNIAYYDPTTYNNLTNLKPEVIAFYKTLANVIVEKEKITAISLKFAQMYEYEKSKGKKNMETARQIEIIKNMFERHIKNRKDKGMWSETHLNNNIQNITEAFDLAIETERLKNKNE